MRKIKLIPILLVFVLLLSACGSNNDQSNNASDKEITQTETQSASKEKGVSQTADNTPPKDLEQNPISDSDNRNDKKLQSVVLEDDTDKHILSPDVVSEQSRKPSDETLNHYPDKDHNTTLENKVIYLEDRAASRALYVLQQAALYTAALIEEKTEGTDASDLINRLDSSVISLLDEHIFNDGFPDIWPFDRDLNLSPEFKAWLINRAKEAGVFDKRLSFNQSQRTSLSVNYKDCDPSSGGLTFTVFGETYTLPALSDNYP